jgi:5-methylcytosine-specific restriction endonuclease McrA
MLQPTMPRLTGRSIAMPPKQADEVYRKRPHIAWAAEVCRLANFTCERCGRSGVRMFADHIVEVKDGGSWDLSNGQALCGSCHTRKTNEAKRVRLRRI